MDEGRPDGSSTAPGEASTAAVTARAMQQLEVPQNLEQYYMRVELDRKLDMLWSFIKTHLGCKMLVFVSSCKQVRFIYETFRHLRPGLPLLHLHGKQKQSKRLEIYSRFAASSASVLLSTDIASRGLDFPNINWVIQLDLAESVQQYVHRIGRTARFNKKGKSLLFLMPSEEEGFMKRLQETGGAGLQEMVKLIKPKESKQQTIQKQFQSLSFQYPEIKFLAQKAFISYVKSVHLQRDKQTFSLAPLDLDKFAKALGLPGTPKIKLLNDKKAQKQAKEKKNKVRDVETLEKDLPLEPEDLAKRAKEQAAKSAGSASVVQAQESDDDKEENNSFDPTADDETSSESDMEGEDESDDDVDGDTDEEEVALESDSSEDPAHEEGTEQIDGQPEPDLGVGATTTSAKVGAPSKTTKYDKMFKRKNQDVLSEHHRRLVAHDCDDDESSAAKDSLLGPDDDQEDFLVPSKRTAHVDETGDSKEGREAADAEEMERLAREYKHDLEDLSKRREKLGQTKKGLLKLRGQGSKINFDESGVGHALYELAGEESIGDVDAARARFLAEEREKMGEVDLLDKAAQRELRREKKREMKRREKEVDGGQVTVGKGRAQEAADDDDDGEDGFQEVDFDFDDLPPTDDEANSNSPPSRSTTAMKRKRQDGGDRQPHAAGQNQHQNQNEAEAEGEDELELAALRALKKGRK